MPESAPEERSRFRLLVRHFIERFFNNDLASADGEAKARLLQIACAAGLPGFMVAIYLYPPYHDIRAARPYWDQVGDHYFYVMYSLVAMALITVYEWDLFFPDRLDIFVLSSLPIKDRELFLARIAAVSLFLGGFLLNCNFLAPLVLPAAMDPPNLIRFLGAHLIAVAMSGTFAAALLLAVQGFLLGSLGEYLFRKLAIVLQGLAITALFTVLLLYPTLVGALSGFMQSPSRLVFLFPPFWFLGIYQRVMEGPAVLPIFTRLAETGWIATLTMVLVSIAVYPAAYRRRTRQLIEGVRAQKPRRRFAISADRLLGAVSRNNPARSAIFHFIRQTLLRVQRFRIYLVMYGGLGIALLIASILRLGVVHGQVRAMISAEGLRIAVPIVAFWTIAGLHMAFVSPSDRSGNWVFRVVLGKPGIGHLKAAREWTLLWALVLTLGTVALAHAISPPNLRGWETTGIQALVAVGFCVWLADAFFFQVKSLPFTGGTARASTLNLALVIIRFLGVFLPLIMITVDLESWLESNPMHVVLAAAAVVTVHLWVVRVQERRVTENAVLRELDEDEEEFPQRLGLRY